MDRDRNWDRIKLATDVIAQGITNKDNPTSDNLIELIEQSYKNDITDEFIKPTVINDYQGFEDGDGIFCTNFRSDRARQILSALLDSNFDEYTVHDKKITTACGVVSYSYKHDEYMGVFTSQFRLITHWVKLSQRAGLNK